MSEREWEIGDKALLEVEIVDVKPVQGVAKVKGQYGDKWIVGLHTLRPLPAPDQRLTPEEQALIVAAERYFVAYNSGAGCMDDRRDFMDAVANLRLARKS